MRYGQLNPALKQTQTHIAVENKDKNVKRVGNKDIISNYKKSPLDS